MVTVQIKSLNKNVSTEEPKHMLYLKLIAKNRHIKPLRYMMRRIFYNIPIQFDY